MMKLVVLSCVLAVAYGSLITPWASTVPLVPTVPLGYAASLGYASSLLAPSVYRGPLSLAPGQPANVIAADGRPLDTLDVNLDRSAHLTARALAGSGAHLLKKRSIAAWGAPVAVSRSSVITSSPIIAPAPIISPASVIAPAPVIASAPVIARSPFVAPATIGLAAPGLLSTHVAAPLGYANSPLIW